MMSENHSPEVFADSTPVDLLPLGDIDQLNTNPIAKLGST